MVAVGLLIALAFSTLVKAFADSIATPLVNAAGGGTTGLGVHVRGQLVDFGTFVSAVVYLVVFMAVVDVAIVPYRYDRSRRGVVCGEPEPTTACPECLSDGLPTAARRCRHCGAEIGAPRAA